MRNIRRHNIKLKNILLLLLVLCLICTSYFVTVDGITNKEKALLPIADMVSLGLDISGGVVVVYEANTDLEGDELTKTLNQARQIISMRINELGLTEPTVSLQGEKRIRIELPGVSNASDAISLIGKTALLEFRTVNDGSIAYTGSSINDFESTEAFTGINVKDSYVTSDEFGKAAVALKFDEEGTKKFLDATLKTSKKDGSNGQIAILLDSVVLTAPYASFPIDKGEAIITGNFTTDEANELALLIRGGALPVVLEEVQTSVIGPTLGLQALSSALTAGIYGAILISIFMILVYRLPGVVSVISLSVYALIILYSMLLLGATLTLPGIAGILISLGMAVDANVIIFERIKEELNAGKTLRSSIDSGFKRAFSTIFDSNITTFIAALVLFVFGEGPIKGFAVTLMLGIVASMFTAITLTWSILKIFSGITSNKVLFGKRREA